MLSIYMKFSFRLNHMKIVAEIYVIPRNMSFAVLQLSLLIHIRFSDDIYSRTFYRCSLFIMHYGIYDNISAYKFAW